MTSLAAVLIIKNEAENLADCLANLSWCDEIIVLDSGSQDDSLEIARQFTDKVYTDPDWQGFGVQRQRAQDKAHADWVFMIDADERVTDQLREEILHVVSQNNQGVVYELPRLSRCFGKYIRHSGWYPDYVLRLYPRAKAAYGPDRVHEKLHFDQSMQIVRLKGDLLHFTYRDLEHYLSKSAQYAKEWAVQRAEQGMSSSLSKGLLHGVGCFIKMYVFSAGFLDGRHGLLLALLSAHSTFAKYADLWIRTRAEWIESR